MSIRFKSTRKAMLTVLAKFLMVVAVAALMVVTLALNAKHSEVAKASPEHSEVFTLLKPFSTLEAIPVMAEFEIITPVTEYPAAEEESPPEVYEKIYEYAYEYILVNMGVFTLTSYCPCVRCTGIWSAEHPSRQGTDFVQRTASGTIPTAGRTIAVDTQTIPHGTTVIINGYEFIAEDKGSSVRGNWIDIFKDCHYEALQFGRQQAEVYIIIRGGEASE